MKDITVEKVTCGVKTTLDGLDPIESLPRDISPYHSYRYRSQEMAWDKINEISEKLNIVIHFVNGEVNKK